jgi:methylmalonyl-CoA/ethylmalonyl-CoA epimerase
MLLGIHHLNFLVRDLDSAAAKFAKLFGVAPGPRTDLPQRGVVTRRFRVGTSWIVLVQPTATDSLPARRLAERGEGLFVVRGGRRDSRRNDGSCQWRDYPR